MGRCCGCPNDGQCSGQDRSDTNDDPDLAVDAPENNGEGEAEDK